jgi:hypothetical protein
MMTYAPIDEAAYEKAAIEISYAKMFPLMVEDFLTRHDCKEMMAESNLIVTVQAGQAVTTTGSPSAQSGSTVSPGQGQVKASYKGGNKRGGTVAEEQEKKAIVEGGGIATGSALGELAG